MSPEIVNTPYWVNTLEFNIKRCSPGSPELHNPLRSARKTRGVAVFAATPRYSIRAGEGQSASVIDNDYHLRKRQMIAAAAKAKSAIVFGLGTGFAANGPPPMVKVSATMEPAVSVAPVVT
jgi:hypothetical protein